jgi:mannose-1-phosphate guanylyltransferase
MRALLLAAGYGSRLRPLTDKIPKCLVPINGIPLLDIWLSRLSLSKIGPFLINVHYLADEVVVHLKNSYYFNNISIVYEETLLGTAGTIIKNINFFNKKDGIVIHADNYCLFNINEFISAHLQRPSNCLLTMMVFRSDRPSECGIVELDNDGIVQGFHEKVRFPPGNLANAAVYIISAELQSMLENEFFDATEFTVDVLPKLIGRIYVYETKDYFIDIGTPASYAKANLYLYNLINKTP